MNCACSDFLRRTVYHDLTCKETAVTFNTNQFIFDKATGHLVQEASTLGYVGGSRLLIESHHTGRQALFLASEEVKDAEGETQAWTFVPAAPFRNGVVKKVVVFND